jgi:hypothetical protein
MSRSPTHLTVSKLVTLCDKHILLRLDPFLNCCPQFIDAIARCTETEINMHVQREPLRMSFVMKWSTEAGKRGWEVIDTAADMRVSTHLIVLLQRRWRAILVQRMHRRTALCMGTHSRLGSKSLVRHMDSDMLQLIGGFL